MEQITPITATYIWTYDEFKAVQAVLSGRPVPKTRISAISTWLTYGLLLVALFWIFVKIYYNGDFPSLKTIQNDWQSIVIYLLPILVVIILWIIFGQNQKRAFLKSPDRDKPVIVTFTADDILIKSELSETRYKWPVVNEVRRTPRGFCFFLGPQIGFWVPFHAFQSNNDIEAVADMSRRLTPKFNVTIA